MDDSYEIDLKNTCSTCLSFERNLSSIRCDYVSLLCSLLSDAVDLQEPVSEKDIKMFDMCWECTAFMKRLSIFREQVCCAQNHLKDVIKYKTNIGSKSCLSRLSLNQHTSFTKDIIYEEKSLDYCNDLKPSIIELKIEADVDNSIRSPFEDVKSPLEEVEDDDDDNDPDWNKDFDCLSLKSNPKRDNDKMKDVSKNKPEVQSEYSNKIYKDSDKYSTVTITEVEMLENIEKSRLKESYASAISKCETCVVGFKSDNELKEHNVKHHKQKRYHIECDICKRYIINKCFTEHRNCHYIKYMCSSCDHVCYDPLEMAAHLKTKHRLSLLSVPDLWKRVKKGVVRKRILKGPRDRRVQQKKVKQKWDSYPCAECNLSFKTYAKKYEHVLKTHRAGYPCPTCGKSFYMKKMLRRHEHNLHTDTLEKCSLCDKRIKKVNMKTHMLTHTQSGMYECVQCDKRYATKNSYNTHMATAKAHAKPDITTYECVSCNKGFARLSNYTHHLKYTKCHFGGESKFKCSMCEKDFRTPGNLRDHVDYTHMGKTKHKCPICDKALSTRRGITRHVSRAHRGIPEKRTRDKICQTCGKAFENKKSLKEHELIHTGERPLSCDICARTFRQSASLYTHKRRVHNFPLKQRPVQFYTEDSTSFVGDKVI